MGRLNPKTEVAFPVALSCTLSVSVEIVASRANFLLLVVVFVLVIESPEIEDEDEDDFGCGLAALRCIAGLQLACARPVSDGG